MANKHCKSFKETLIAFLQIFLDWILEFALGWYLGEKRNVVSLKNEEEEILQKSAVDLAKLIRERKLSSYKLVDLYIKRIKEVNKQINAVVDGPFEEALQEAKEIDKGLDENKFSEEELKAKPFLGVPFTTKDSTAVGGKLHTLGLLSRKNELAKEDSECVRLIKNAGAIIIATSNIPEVNKWIEARNMLIGTTNNPYDLRRSVGGSSGGEGALITACCTAFGLGSDIGGSIRIPAFCCGVFGHKSSIHSINTRGLTFRTGKEKQTMVVAGPMARHATDLMPLFKAIADPEKINLLKLDSPVDVKKLRYFYVDQNGMKLCNPINNETQMMMNRVRKHFKELTGKDVEIAKLPNLHLSGKMWRYWMTQEPACFSKLLGNGIELNPYIEITKKFLGQSSFTMAAIYNLIDTLLPKEKEYLMRAATEELKKALEELLGDDGILFYYSSPRTAPFHYYSLVKFNDFHYFSIFNVLQVPATQVPMGLDSKGLPLGIQVVSNLYNDRLCMAVAEELEKQFGGWVPPFAK